MPMSTARQTFFRFGLTLLWVVPLLVLFLNVSQPAAQQAEAEVLVARAVLAYDDERYEEALELLQRALQLDPRHARGLYYAGLVHLALKQPREAVDSLDKARGLRPTDVNVRFQLGVAYFTLGDYARAGPLLEQVFQEQPDLENLGYYVGFMRYRQKAYSEAVEAFEAVKTSDPNVRQLSQFYRGLAHGVLGLPEQAIAELEEAQRTQAAEPLTQAAIRIRERLAAGRPVVEARRLRAQVSFGGFYDDNVAINPDPSNDATAEGLRRRGTTATGLLGSVVLDYSFLRMGPVEATASYSFFQTLNFNALDRFNIQDHLGGLAGFYRGTTREMPYQLGVQYTYDYLFLDEAGFLSRHTPTFTGTLVPPTVTLPVVGPVGNLTTALVRYQVKEFFREAGDDDVRFGAERRDGFNTMFGFVHAFRFAQDRYLLRVGYQYDNEATDGAAFSYSGNRLTTGGTATLPWGDITLRYDYDVHWRAYKNPQSLFLNNEGVLAQRYDIQQTHLVQIAKPLPADLRLTLQYQGIRNGSQIPVYDYSKNVFSVIVSWIY